MTLNDPASWTIVNGRVRRATVSVNQNANLSWNQVKESSSHDAKRTFWLDDDGGDAVDDVDDDAEVDE